MEFALVMVVLLALLFDFTNGFHDTANSIATMVGTRALDPQKAVLLAASLNFIGAFWSLEVAATVAKDMVSPDLVTMEVLMGGLTGAIVWNFVTWAYGIPSSSSHALVGGLVGAMLGHAGSAGVLWNGVVHKVLVPAVVAPVLGLVSAMVLMGVLMRVFHRANPTRANRGFRLAQLASGGFLSFSHGTNDAQKTMGIIALALVASGHLPADDFSPPIWVVLAAASAMGLGTYAGGWRIIKTLGGKVVKMQPMQGFAASSAAAGVLFTTAHLGFPVSTTHCVSGCVMGSGASRRLSSVRWSVAFDIITAWVLTLPSTAIVGFAAFLLVSIHPVVLLVVTGAILAWLRMRQQQGAVPAH